LAGAAGAAAAAAASLADSLALAAAVARLLARELRRRWLGEAGRLLSCLPFAEGAAVALVELVAELPGVVGLSLAARRAAWLGAG